VSRRAFIAALAGAAAWPSFGRAEARFPSKTMRIIVPFTPGGSNDVVAREIASGLQANLNQPAVVENKPGGGGNMLIHMWRNRRLTGTPLIVPASFTIGPHLSRNRAITGQRFCADQPGRRRAVRAGGARRLCQPAQCSSSSRLRNPRRPS
jgi:tripartite-type tricarboxylate transporter receptor subunit TctC